MDMDRISELPEELRLKILSFLTTKKAVSTSTLSKQWEFLWRWLPSLEYDFSNFKSKVAFREYINNNLPLHRAPVLDRFSLKLYNASLEPDDINAWVETPLSRCVRELKTMEAIKPWVEIVVSRCVRELSIQYYINTETCVPRVLLPSSLYTCKSLATLILAGKMVLVDVPPVGSLPCLKKLDLTYVTYSNQDSLPLLISYCPALEDLCITRSKDDNSSQLVVTCPLLQRLYLHAHSKCSSGGYVIVTPSLKYLNFDDERDSFSFSIENMPKLEVADITVSHNVEKLFASITSVKRLSLHAYFKSGQESLYPAGIVFKQLKDLSLCLDNPHWPQLLLRLLEDSPKLRILDIYSNISMTDHAPLSWKNISAPKCLFETLESFEFGGYNGKREERDFLSYFFKTACCLKQCRVARVINSAGSGVFTGVNSEAYAQWDHKSDF